MASSGHKAESEREEQSTITRQQGWEVGSEVHSSSSNSNSNSIVTYFTLSYYPLLRVIDSVGVYIVHTVSCGRRMNRGQTAS
jgi:hypothetical protein